MTCSSEPFKQPRKAGNPARKIQQGGMETINKSAPPNQCSPSGNCPTKKTEEHCKSIWEKAALHNISTCQWSQNPLRKPSYRQPPRIAAILHLLCVSLCPHMMFLWLWRHLLWDELDWTLDLPSGPLCAIR